MECDGVRVVVREQPGKALLKQEDRIACKNVINSL